MNIKWAIFFIIIVLFLLSEERLCVWEQKHSLRKQFSSASWVTLSMNLRKPSCPIFLIDRPCHWSYSERISVVRITWNMCKIAVVEWCLIQLLSPLYLYSIMHPFPFPLENYLQSQVFTDYTNRNSRCIRCFNLFLTERHLPWVFIAICFSCYVFCIFHVLKPLYWCFMPACKLSESVEQAIYCVS